MGKSYSLDLRNRVLGHIKGGRSRRDASRRFGVSLAVKLTGRVARKGRPPGRGKLAAHIGALIGWVEAQPDITMPELAAKLKAARGVKAHPGSLSRALLMAGFTFKKNTTGQRVRTRGRSSRA
jgi:transposase